MVSFSNFGGNKHPAAEKVRKAVRIAKERRPDLVIDGEMQADVAVAPELMKSAFSFSSLQGDANVLIFPELNSRNRSRPSLKTCDMGRTTWKTVWG